MRNNFRQLQKLDKDDLVPHMKLFKEEIKNMP